MTVPGHRKQKDSALFLFKRHIRPPPLHTHTPQVEIKAEKWSDVQSLQLPNLSSISATMTRSKVNKRSHNAY